MSEPKDHELPIPATVYGESNPRELFRAWAAHEELHVSFNPLQLWDDPTDWGVFLVDMARHVARAYEQEGVCSASTALVKIKSGFEVEWHRPDSGATQPAPQKDQGN